MDKQTQDLAWACLPKDVRDEIKDIYKAKVNSSEYTEFCQEMILDEIFGIHNLTSNAEPSELLFVERRDVQEIYHHFKIGHDPIDKDNEFNSKLIEAKRILMLHLFGDKCLPDKPINGAIGTTPPAYKLDVETKVAENPNMVKSPQLNKGNMEGKELNLAELLKDAIGEEIYSPTFGVVKVSMANCNCIGVDPWNHNSKSFQTDGRYVDKADAVISLFPSKALYEKYPLDAYSAWMEWKEARKPKRWRAGKYEKYFFITEFTKVSIHEDCEGTVSDRRYKIGNYFRTEDEAQQAAEAVRETLMKFHEKFSAQNLDNPK